MSIMFLDMMLTIWLRLIGVGFFQFICAAAFGVFYMTKRSGEAHGVPHGLAGLGRGSCLPGARAGQPGAVGQLVLPFK